jgi:maltose O-acetyltransferase
MRSLRLYLICKVMVLLPSTRFYSFKVALLSWAGCDISKTARVVSSAKIVGTGSLKIGVDTFIGHDVFISCSPPGVEIGSFVDIAPRVSIINGTHDVDMLGRHTAGPGKCLPINIKDGVWIGAGAIILPGVTIGEKSIIGAGSVVSGDIPAYTLSVGVPCRPIKRWDADNNKFVIFTKGN